MYDIHNYHHTVCGLHSQLAVVSTGASLRTPRVTPRKVLVGWFGVVKMFIYNKDNIIYDEVGCISGYSITVLIHYMYVEDVFIISTPNLQYSTAAVAIVTVVVHNRALIFQRVFVCASKSCRLSALKQHK